MHTSYGMSSTRVCTYVQINVVVSYQSKSLRGSRKKKKKCGFSDRRKGQEESQADPGTYLVSLPGPIVYRLGAVPSTKET